MSATNRGAERKPLDAYYTDPWCTKAILRASRGLAYGADIEQHESVLDPCCGVGDILQVLPNRVRIGRDIDPEAVALCSANIPNEPGRIVRLDVANWYTTYTPEACFYEGKIFDPLVVTNPPFGQKKPRIDFATPFVSRALERGLSGWWLLRLMRQGSDGRRWFLRRYLWYIRVLGPVRPKFGRNLDGSIGTDNTEYAWCFYRPQSRPKGTDVSFNWADRVPGT